MENVNYSKNRPCYNCEVRFVGCHSSCNKYIEWKTKYEDEKKQQALHRKVEMDFIAHHANLGEKIRRGCR